MTRVTNIAAAKSDWKERSFKDSWWLVEQLQLCQSVSLIGCGVAPIFKFEGKLVLGGNKLARGMARKTSPLQGEEGGWKRVRERGGRE